MASFLSQIGQGGTWAKTARSKHCSKTHAAKNAICGCQPRPVTHLEPPRASRPARRAAQGPPQARGLPRPTALSSNRAAARGAAPLAALRAANGAPQPQPPSRRWLRRAWLHPARCGPARAARGTAAGAAAAGWGMPRIAGSWPAVAQSSAPAIRERSGAATLRAARRAPRDVSS